jgi:hypothetical protein
VRLAVKRIRGQMHGVYEFAQEFDGALREQIVAARELLIRHGITVGEIPKCDTRMRRQPRARSAR